MKPNFMYNKFNRQDSYFVSAQTLATTWISLEKKKTRKNNHTQHSTAETTLARMCD